MRWTQVEGDAISDDIHEVRPINDVDATVRAAAAPLKTLVVRLDLEDVR